MLSQNLRRQKQTNSISRIPPSFPPLSRSMLQQSNMFPSLAVNWKFPSEFPSRGKVRFSIDEIERERDCDSFVLWVFRKEAGIVKWHLSFVCKICTLLYVDIVCETRIQIDWISEEIIDFCDSKCRVQVEMPVDLSSNSFHFLFYVRIGKIWDTLNIYISSRNSWNV